MKTLLRAFLPLALLLAAVAPAAAVDELPAPTPEAVPFVVPVEPAPCSIETVAAVEAGTPGAVGEPCLLPDGTLYELASNGGETPIDYAALYEQWQAEFLAGLEACPEGTDPADMTITTCLLLDGTVAGPMPLWAAGPGTDGIEKENLVGAAGAEDESRATLEGYVLAGLTFLTGALMVAYTLGKRRARR
jgi:hypothetical protein